MKYTREEIVDGTMEYINNNSTIYNQMQNYIKLVIDLKKKNNNIDVVNRCSYKFFKYYKNSYFGEYPVRLYALKEYFEFEVNEAMRCTK